jgi:hypothetical protein
MDFGIRNLRSRRRVDAKELIPSHSYLSKAKAIAVAFWVAFAQIQFSNVSSTRADDVVTNTDLMSEVRKLRESNRQADVNISQLAQKYIKQDENRAAVLEYFNQHGFKVYEEAKPEKGVTTVVGSHNLEPGNVISRLLGFYDEIRVIATLRNGAVFKVEGFLFYHAL